MPPPGKAGLVTQGIGVRSHRKYILPELWASSLTRLYSEHATGPRPPALVRDRLGSGLSDRCVFIRCDSLRGDLDISPGQAHALNRRHLIQKFGHLTFLLWARLILGRFRDDVSRLPLESTTGAGKGADSDDPVTLLKINGGAYRGSRVPGA